MEMLVPTETPQESAARKLQEEAIRMASAAGFRPGSPRHTQHVLAYIRGEWEGPVTEPIIPAAVARNVKDYLYR